MKILFDQNLSPKLAIAFGDLFPGSTHVIDLALDDSDDWEVWNHAAANDFVLASKDTDFRDRSLVQGHPPKVILVTTGNCPTATVEKLFRGQHVDILNFAAHAKMSLTELK